MPFEELKKRVAKVNYMMYKSGIAFSIWGHASARVPGKNLVLVKPVQIPFRDVKARDIAVVDMTGRQVAGKLRPPVEIHVHTSIYRAREDVGGIVHAHPLAVTAFAAAGKPIRPIYNEGSYWLGEKGIMPIFEPSELITTKELGDGLAKALGDNTAVLIRNHGMAVTGKTIEHALMASWYIERLARVQAMAMSIGEPTQLSPDLIKLLIERTPPDYVDKLWQHFEGEFSDRSKFD